MPLQLPQSVRHLSDAVIGSVRIPILGGLNRGRWWSIASAGGGYATGQRAPAQMALLRALIRPGDVVWDVGAHHGYVTLLAARCVGPEGAVHVFEPSARNRAQLERHVRWNGCTNVTVHGDALSDRDGEATFGGSGSSKMYALGRGAERVRVRRAASLVAEGRLARPTFVKLDVEGAEADALAGALDVLPATVRMLVAMHGPESDRRATALLERAGFRMRPSRHLAAARRGPWFADPDLFCAGPAASGWSEDCATLDAADF